MNTVIRTLSCCLVAFLPLAAAVNCPGRGDRATMLVSTDWLAAHLKDPNLVLLSVGAKAEYDKQHIEGARYVDMATVSAKNATLTLQLPPMAELQETFRGLGVSNNSRIILYSIAPAPQAATRIFWTLDAMGLAGNVSLLNGGLPQWLSEKRAVTSAVPAVTPGTVEPCPQTPNVLAEASYVSEKMASPGVRIVDARLNTYYTGEQIPPNQRAGHVPGAASIPYASLIDEAGKLKSDGDLKAIFTAANIKPADQVVSYCHVGQQATLVYFVARYLGFDARMFDGSWQEWSQKTELPVKTGNLP